MKTPPDSSIAKLLAIPSPLAQVAVTHLPVAADEADDPSRSRPSGPGGR